MPQNVKLPTGENAVFPDGMPEDQILSTLDQHFAQQQQVQQFQQEPPLAQAIMKAVGPQFGFQVPEPDAFRLPVLKGNTFGMTPETLNNTLGIVQNTQNMNASERIRQRVQMEQQMEQEKDRAQQLKLEQQRFKNQQMIEKMREQQEADAERRKNTTGSVSNVSGVGPVVTRMGELGQWEASALPIQNAPKPEAEWLKLGNETIMGEDGTPQVVSILADKANPSKIVRVPFGQAAPKDKKFVRVDTVDEQGNPVTRFVPEGEGAYPKPSPTQRPMTPIQRQQLRDREAEMLAKIRPDLLQPVLDEAGEPAVDYKGAPLMRPKPEFSVELDKRLAAWEAGEVPSVGGGAGSSTITPGEGGVLNMVFK